MKVVNLIDKLSQHTILAWVVLQASSGRTQDQEAIVITHFPLDVLPGSVLLPQFQSRQDHEIWDVKISPKKTKTLFVL